MVVLTARRALTGLAVAGGLVATVAVLLVVLVADTQSKLGELLNR